MSSHLSYCGLREIQARHGQAIYGVEGSNNSGMAGLRIDTISEPTQSRTTLASFAGMTIEVDQADYYLPQIHVTANGTAYRAALIGEGFPGDTPNAPPSIRSKIESWFDIIVPTLGRSVAALVYDQWLRARNGQPAEMVPSPEQIVDMGSLPKKPTFTGDYYAIERIATLPGLRLRVHFLNGETRVADIKAMRGDSGFEQVFANFHAARNEVHHVEWTVIFPDGPNTLEIEDQDLWGAGVLVRSS